LLQVVDRATARRRNKEALHGVELTFHLIKVGGNDIPIGFSLSSHI
jgi:hypothetical protein